MFIFAGGSPPVTSTTGTWGNASTGVAHTLEPGGSINSGGIEFEATFTGTITQVKFKTLSGTINGTWVAKLYSTTGTNPSSQIGSDSGSQAMSANNTEYTFTFASPPSVTATTRYWIVLTPASGTPQITVDNCANDASYKSGRHSTITSIADGQFTDSRDIRSEISILH